MSLAPPLEAGINAGAFVRTRLRREICAGDLARRLDCDVGGEACRRENERYRLNTLLVVCGYGDAAQRRE